MRTQSQKQILFQFLSVIGNVLQCPNKSKSNYSKISGANTEKVLTWICQSSIDISDLYVSQTVQFLFKPAFLWTQCVVDFLLHI